MDWGYASKFAVIHESLAHHGAGALAVRGENLWLKLCIPILGALVAITMKIDEE
jgi:hypothetical protein